MHGIASEVKVLSVIFRFDHDISQNLNAQL